MKCFKKIIVLCLATAFILVLQGCSSFNGGWDDEFWSEDETVYENGRPIPERTARPFARHQYNSRYRRGARRHHRARRRGVHVPQTYHLNSGLGPEKHKYRDADWVNRQNPTSYTIELGRHNKRSEAANTIHRAPKGNRKAQIKINQGGKTVHSSVYGSYKDQASADAALKKLPADVREKAKVKQWHKIQGDE